ncbi:MAG: T9SS type A sorting domain-containing protein [Bacteroidia bacterium]|nr:T9SS type A sorting domain-containing protein [Bacteroidota bacterium]MBP9083756.1 T9SS type A sorting domain-containing protein [Bacteroidia bacterium]
MKSNPIQKKIISDFLSVCLFIFLLTLSPFSTNGQFFSYAKAFGGTGYTNTYPVGVKIDNLGNLYTAGNFTETVDFDPGPGIFNLSAVGWTDFYVAKMDFTGNLIHAFSIGSVDNQMLNGFEFDQTGNLVLYGYFNSTVDFDPGPGVFNLVAGSGTAIGLCGFIAKYDTAGNFIMAKQFNSPGFGINVGLQSLIIDNNNEIMIFGRFRGSVDFDPGAGTHILSSNNDNNFLLKLDSTGAFIWAKKFGNNNSTISADRAVFDGAQSVYFAGSFYNNNDFDPNSTVYYMTGGTNFFNGFVLKLNTDGEFIWARNIGSSLDNDNVNGVALDPGFSNIYISGIFKDTFEINFVPMVGLIAVGGYDNFLLKLDTSGTFQWVNSFGNYQYDRMSAVTADQYGVYATGIFYDTLDFYSAFGGSLIIGSSFYNAYACKYTHSGNPVWIYSFNNSSGYVDPYHIATDTFGNIYITGTFQTTTDFDQGPLNYYITSLGGHDIFVHKTGVVNPTGLVDLEQFNSALLFPNPTNRKITVKFNQEYSDLALDLFNSAGQRIQDFKFYNKQVVDLDLILTPGVYFIKIETSKGSLGTRKILIQ